MAGFWADTPPSVTGGDSVDIEISDPTRQNQTITVSITRDDGDPGNPATVDVALDSNGNGSTPYVAPADAAFVKLNAAEAPSSHRVDIT